MDFFSLNLSVVVSARGKPNAPWKKYALFGGDACEDTSCCVSAWEISLGGIVFLHSGPPFLGGTILDEEACLGLPVHRQLDIAHLEWQV